MTPRDRHEPPGADDEGFEAHAGHQQPDAPQQPRTPRQEPNGIDGLQGREPIAAALSVGVKGPSGAPVDKDRFHVLVSEASPGERQGKFTLVRPPHPSFASFNGAPAGRRQTIPAKLAHATVSECWEHSLKAQVLPGIVHPRKAPVCKGDGVRAERWDPDREDYVSMACPHDRCPHRQTDGRKPAACKPWMRFLARFDFPRTDGKGLPNVLFKYASGGWNTVKNFLGFFESFEKACRNLDVDPAAVPLFGMPVVLQLQERTDPAGKRRFPVVSIAVGGDMDVIAWILWQRERVKEIAGLPPIAGLLEVIDDDDRDLVSGPVGLGR